MKEYVTIGAEEVSTEIVIEKSRFIAAAKQVNSAEEAMSFVAEKRKKYFDATHNCYAWIVDDKAKFSDDGEPQGTAGMPMYECLKSSKLDHICVVVTRYFGGIKLGAGGLVRAYSGATSAVTKACAKLKITDCARATVTIDYSLLSPLKRALDGKCVVENVLYDDKVTLVCLFPAEISTTISDIVCQTTLGKAVFAVTERLLCHYSIE